jgi:putative membrane protein
MKKFVIKIGINAVALYLASLLFHPGIKFEGHGGQLVQTVLIVALIFGLVNTFVRPVVKLFSLPLYLLTLGLITFVINALMLWLTSAISAHFAVQFHVGNFLDALIGSLVITVVSMVAGMVLPDAK